MSLSTPTPSLLGHRFLFVVGKGGVGKTTVGAAIALAAASKGKRVLLAMCNAKERVSAILGVPPVGAHNVTVMPNLDVVNMMPREALEEYGLMVLRSRTLFKAVFESNVVSALLRGTPGIEAWSMLGKAYFHTKETLRDGRPRYDLVIVDAPATGHGLEMRRVAPGGGWPGTPPVGAPALPPPFRAGRGPDRRGSAGNARGGLGAASPRSGRQSARRARGDPGGEPPQALRAAPGPEPCHAPVALQRRARQGAGGVARGGVQVVRPHQVHHPIQVAIEDVYAAGHTPRLQVDSRRRDVEVPDFIRRAWQARLVIDLDPSYPLDLAYDADGISVDLAFQGQVTRCKLGWAGVYAVIDRTTGRGIVIEAHLPAAELALEDAWIDRTSKRPKLSALPSSKETSSKEPAPAPPKQEEPPSPSVAPIASSAEPPADAARADEAAKERRARFRVSARGG